MKDNYGRFTRVRKTYRLRYTRAELRELWDFVGNDFIRFLNLLDWLDRLP